MTTNEELTIQEIDDPIALEEKLIELRDKRQPLYEQVSKINHEIEQTKSKLKIANLRYWAEKGK